jgi:hypothetical protein
MNYLELLLGKAQPAAAGDRLRDGLLAGGTGAAVLIASLVNFLAYQQYPLLRPEIGIVVAALLAVAALVGAVYGASGHLVRALLQIYLVVVAVDLNTDGLAAIAAAVAILLVFNRHAMLFLRITSAIVAVTALITANSGTSGAIAVAAADGEAVERPALVHLVLDEHIGVEGILGDQPQKAALRAELKSFYTGNGFKLFGGAYGEYFRTVNAIPQMLNFGVEQPWRGDVEDGVSLKENAYFDRLGELGYRIRVLQTDFLDYCSNAAVSKCHSERAANVGAIIGSRMTVREKAWLIGLVLANRSGMLWVGMDVYDTAAIWARQQGFAWPRATHEIPNFGARAALNHLAEELRQARPGDAFFAHVLLPHSPYLLDRNCRLRDDWREHVNDTLELRERAYTEQVSCATTKVRAALEAIAQSPAGANAIVIVQGDHGSRVFDTPEHKGAFTDEELVAGYSTLFAIRAPGLEPGYDPRPLPAWALLDAAAWSEFKSAEPRLDNDFVPTVTLEDEDWRPVEKRPLPKWWTDSLADNAAEAGS